MLAWQKIWELIGRPCLGPTGRRRARWSCEDKWGGEWHEGHMARMETSEWTSLSAVDPNLNHQLPPPPLPFPHRMLPPDHDFGKQPSGQPAPLGIAARQHYDIAYRHSSTTAKTRPPLLILTPSQNMAQTPGFPREGARKASNAKGMIVPEAEMDQAVRDLMRANDRIDIQSLRRLLRSMNGRCEKAWDAFIKAHRPDAASEILDDGRSTSQQMSCRLAFAVAVAVALALALALPP